MRILLLGGTGSMGVHLTEILKNAGHDVSVTTRSSRMSKSTVKYIQGNAKDNDFLENLLKDKWDVIVDFMVYSTTEFENRVDFLLKSTSQYIYLSSSRVYSEYNGVMTENSPRLLDSSSDSEFLLTSDYSLEKARQENILVESSIKNWTIIRPYITYSEDRLQLGVLEKEHWLYRALKGKTIVFSEDIMKHVTTLTYGYDVSSAIFKVIGDATSLGEIFHITCMESVEWSRVLDIYLGVLEKKLGFRPKVILPNKKELLKFNAAKYQIIYDRLFDRRFDTSKIGRLIDVSSFKSIEIGLIECLNKFLDNPVFLPIDWKSEARRDKIANESTSFKEISGLKNKIKYIVFRYIL